MGAATLRPALILLQAKRPRWYSRRRPLAPERETQAASSTGFFLALALLETGVPAVNGATFKRGRRRQVDERGAVCFPSPPAPQRSRLGLARSFVRAEEGAGAALRPGGTDRGLRARR